MVSKLLHKSPGEHNPRVVPGPRPLEVKGAAPMSGHGDRAQTGKRATQPANQEDLVQPSATIATHAGGRATLHRPAVVRIGRRPDRGRADQQHRR